VTVGHEAVRLEVTNDGVAAHGPARYAANDGTGAGLVNLRARMQAFGGWVTCRRAGGQFRSPPRFR
jgi:signal transduction histidine kinase